MDIIAPGQDFAKKGVSLTLYGDSGVGKTSTIKTLLGWSHDKVKVKDGVLVEDGWGTTEPYCKPEEILVLSADAGEIVLEREGKTCCSIYRVPDTLEKWKDFVDYLCAGKHPFKVVVADNMSELEYYFVTSVAKKRGAETPSKEDWMRGSLYLKKYMRQLRDLTFLGIDVIFIFWTMDVPIEDKDGQLTTVIYPKCMRRSKEEYIGLVEHCAYMGISQKSGERFFQFESGGLYKAKTRSELIQKFEKANLAAILRKLRGR